MSEQDEVMRLSAEIVNRWSGPLNDMRRDLRKLADDVKGTHAAGAAHVKKHSEAVTGLRKEFQRLDEHVKSTSLQTMAAFGVGALSVAGAVSAVKDAVFGFADSTRQMKFLSRETGATIQQLREFEALSRRLGAAPGVMSKGVQDFAQHMHDIRRRVPAEMDALKDNLRYGGLNGFVQGLANLPIGEAISRAIGKLDTIPDPLEKKQYLRLLGLPENLADVPVAELRQMMQEIRKNIGTLGPDAEKSALKFEGAIDRMNDSIEKLKLTVGSELADAFSDATDQIREFVTENRDGLVGVLKDVSGGIHGVLTDARELMKVYRELRGGEMGPSLKKFLGEKDVDSIQGGLDWLSKHSDQGQRFLQTPSNIPPGADFMPMAYHPGGGGLRSGGRFTMTGAGASSGSPEEVIAKGTHIGVLRALREFRYEVEGGDAAGGGAGVGGRGLSLAAYHPSGSAGMPAGHGGAVHRLLAPPSPDHPSAAPSYGPQRFTIGDIHRAVTGKHAGDGGIGPVNPIGGRQPASIRYNNPGAQWPRPGDARFGAMGFGRLADGNLIERFPDPSYGAAANMALFASRYTGMRLGAAGARWTGGHGFGVPGYDPNMIITPEMMNDPAFAIPFMKSIARREAGRESPLSNEQWMRAFQIFRAGGIGQAGQQPSLHGEALRHHFGYRGHGGQLRKQSGLDLGGRQEGGNAKLHVHLANFPKGTRSKLVSSGFKEVKLSRGSTMKSQES